MCNFLSAIFTRSGKLICEPLYTDSHSELLEWAGIEERETTAPVQQFVRLELLPPSKAADWLEVENWESRIDDHEIPEWFDRAKRFDAFEQMREIITDAIVDGDGRLTFGKLIIARSGAVRCRGSRVVAHSGSSVVAHSGSSVDARSGSSVDARSGSSVVAHSGSSVDAHYGSSVVAHSGSSVDAHYGSSVVARNGSSVVARNGSSVVARNGSSVDAHSGSSVVAHSGSSVDAHSGSSVVAHSGSEEPPRKS